MNTDELIAHVSAQIGRLADTYEHGASASDLYEAALLVVAIASMRAAGATSVLLTNDGTSAASEISLRRSPGYLWTPGFTYAVAAFPGTSRTCEAHLGVFVVGESGVPHECDVAVLDGREAERSRRGKIHPRKSGLIAAIEAKHYAASPGIDIGRAFIGLASEMGHARSSLAFPAQGATTLMRLLARRSSECFDSAVPGDAATERLGAHIEQTVRNWRARIR
ncbi:hypothetical protein FBY41_1736 [Humibacillus xanthopallidus]|uniref:Uncharacterized protein n=1 Tax=Humibacillus xanthopallidus TaxID=412689 RepID=A0A543HTN3_9MICO|nr:hypothetical protein FBY41_1736 [Humibacillus xanthopallidus]